MIIHKAKNHTEKNMVIIFPMEDLAKKHGIYIKYSSTEDLFSISHTCSIARSIVMKGQKKIDINNISILNKLIIDGDILTLMYNYKSKNYTKSSHPWHDLLQLAIDHRRTKIINWMHNNVGYLINKTKIRR